MKYLVKFVPLVIVFATVGGCYSSCTPTPPNPTYTLIWNTAMSGFPNVNLTLTPIIPPKALSWKPSDYVRVNLTVGNFSFSTDDPAYQCLETVATTVLPIIFAPESEISDIAAINDFLVGYQACGQFLQTSHADLASLGGIAAKELIFFKITGQKMVSRAANGQEFTPSGPVSGTIPTPTPPPSTPTPTPVTPIINFKASLSPSVEYCTGSTTVLPPFKLSLDNTGSNVDVQWTATFREQSPSGSPWGSGQSSGTVTQTDTSDIVITPALDLCNVPANSVDTYHLDISYGEVNQGLTSPLTLTYEVFGYKNT